MAGWQRKDCGVVLRYFPQTRLPACTLNTEGIHLTGSLFPIHTPVKHSERRLETAVASETRHESAYRNCEKGDRSPVGHRPLKTQDGRRKMDQSFDSVSKKKHHASFLPSFYNPPCPVHLPHKSIQPKPLSLPPCLYSKLPRTKPKWQATTRLTWKRRLLMKTTPIVILHFEGVIGEFVRVLPWTTGVELCVRDGLDKGLSRLFAKFQTVLVTSLGKEQRKFLLDVLKKRSGVIFDAVYKLRKSDGTSFLLDYSQIISDFSLNRSKSVNSPMDSVLIVSSLGLNTEDLECRRGLDLLCDSTVSGFRRYLCHAAPVPGPKVPVCLFVPHPRAQDGNMCVGFEEVVTVVEDLAGSAGSFGEGYEETEGEGLRKGEVALGLMVEARREVSGRQGPWEEGKLRFIVQCGRRSALGDFAPLPVEPGKKVGRKQSLKLVV